MSNEREARLDRIREASDKLAELARRFDRLKFIAEEDSSDCFLVLVEAAGQMTLSSLDQLGTLLEIMFCAMQEKEHGD